MPHQNALGTTGGALPIITHVDVELVALYAVSTDEQCTGPTDLSQIFLDRILQRKSQTDPSGPEGLNSVEAPCTSLKGLL